MKTKQLITAALSLVLAFGSFTVLPEKMYAGQGITAAAAKFETIKGISATPGTGSIKLKWNPVDKAAKYAVGYCKANSFASDFLNTTEPSCDITGLENSVAYDITIYAYDSNDNIIGIGSIYNITTNGAASIFSVKKDDEGKSYLASYNGHDSKVTVPTTVEYIGEGAFAGNNDITEVVIPASCTLVETNAFNSCGKLKKVVFKGDASIGNSAFQYCINLKTVEIKGSFASEIGSRAFSSCQALESITAEKNTSEFEISYRAFENCYSLKEFAIPDKCTNIYGEAFLNCTKLKEVVIPANTKFKSFGKTNRQLGYIYSSKNADYQSKDLYYAVADGKSRVYVETYSTTQKSKATTASGFYINYNQVTPVKLTMIVSKGSDAESYAKKNGIDFKYSSEASSAKLAAPQNLKATKKTASSISISWSAVDGAEKYIVYLRNPKTGKYEKYSTVSDTKCTIKKLKKGTSYKIKVVAVQKVNGKSKAGSSSKALTVKTSSK
ncbi:MAG: fibronectin type III domain-containing protein [Oscillospiraceae bacterium]